MLSEVSMAHHAPETCATADIKNTSWGFAREGSRKDGTSKQLEHEQCAKRLPVQFRKVYGEGIRYGGLVDVGAAISNDKGFGILEMTSMGLGSRRSGKRSCREGATLFSRRGEQRIVRGQTGKGAGSWGRHFALRLWGVVLC